MTKCAFVLHCPLFSKVFMSEVDAQISVSLIHLRHCAGAEEAVQLQQDPKGSQERVFPHSCFMRGDDAQIEDGKDLFFDLFISHLNI